jgi:hypothetical protein
MAEQKYTQKTMPPDMTLYPAEGRADVASDVEEEQREAYSAHHKAAPSQAGGGTQQPASGYESLAIVNQAELPPVEGRVDVASDVEEEQRDAYSAHHH